MVWLNWFMNVVMSGCAFSPPAMKSDGKNTQYFLLYEKCKGGRLNTRKWIWKMEWMNNASYMSFIERVNNESTRYMY